MRGDLSCSSTGSTAPSSSRPLPKGAFPALCAGNAPFDVGGGRTSHATLRLSKAFRLKLALRDRLRVTAVVAARDAAGNHRTTSLRLTLRAPAA